MKKRAVIALGGNALIKKGQKGTVYEQFAQTRESTQPIIKLIKQGWDIVITHGNGPQVGAIMIQNKEAAHLTPVMPLGICVAKSQGFIGYMIQQTISNALQKEKIHRSLATLITQVIINPDDPALLNPTKPIGPYYSEEEAKQLQKENITLKKTEKGWRMVVPSPDPISVVESEVIKKLVDQATIVIAAGGGGMPVIEKKDWGLDGYEAVVDKDLTSQKIATAIQADLLVILTDIEKVYINYNTTQQQPLDTISLRDIKKYYKEKQFAEGSMAPKILAAIRFLESGGQKVIISDIDNGWKAIQGKTGTHIVQ
jgi:carbamate kinase